MSRRQVRLAGSGADILEVRVAPLWPLRLSRGGWGDGVVRREGAWLLRIMRPRGPAAPAVVACACQHQDGSVLFRAAPAPPAERASVRGRSRGRRGDRVQSERDEPARREDLALAIERMRFATGVDEDLSLFFGAFRGDQVLGPALAARPELRPKRRAIAWEALAWAVTEQLIESTRAAAIQRRLVWRFGEAFEMGGERPLLDVPAPSALARLAPAELAACDLAPKRALALIRTAREVATGRVDPSLEQDDERLRRVREIGPWTLQCLGHHGRGEADTLPVGDLAYLKLVGRLAGLGRLATIEEVEEFFEPYAPYRALAGWWMQRHYHHAVETGPPLRLAA